MLWFVQFSVQEYRPKKGKRFVFKILRKNFLYAVFSLIVTIGIFSYLLSHVSLGEVFDLIRGADRRGVAMFLVLSIAMSVFRTWRYLLCLRTSGYVPPSSSLFLVVIVRNFFSDLLPARLGTLIYVYIVTSRLGVPFSAAASSFSLSFLFDMVALAPMIALAALATWGSTGISPVILVSAGCALMAITVAVLCALPWMFSIGGRILGQLSLFPAARRSKWQAAWEKAEQDVRDVRSTGIYDRLMTLSILVRVAKYGSLYVFLFALIGPKGYGFAQLNVPRVFLGLCSSELAASLPISGIAGFGAYEGAWALVFELLGFPADIAKLTSVSHHLFTQIYGYSLGALALMILMIPFFKHDQLLDRQTYPVGSRGLFYTRVLASVVLTALILMAIYHLS
jgi:uncharacterized protein (TIRG00374 family)